MIFGCSKTGAEPLPASYLDDKEDHLSLEDNEVGGSDETGVIAVAADAGRPKGSKDRGPHRRGVAGICGTQV